MAAASVDLERRLVALGVAPEQAKKDAASKSAAAIAETIAEAEPLPKDAAEKGAPPQCAHALLRAPAA
jgi:hypothetical protein